MNIHLRFSVAAALLIAGCGGQSSPPSQRPIVVAVEGDVDSFNPLFAEEQTSGEINDLLYPALVGSEFDRTMGALTYTPMLARSWDYTNGHRSITFHLISGALWSDGMTVTAKDVKTSYMLYGDEEVASVRQSSVEGLRTTGGRVDVDRSIVIVDDTTIVFHFEKAYAGQLFDAGLPVLPSHIFGSIPPKELRTAGANQQPVSAGPFLLSQRTPLQEIVLVPNEKCRLPHPAKSAIVFRVVPDYHTRIQQLISGEVDVVSGIRPGDAQTLETSAPRVRLVSIAGRDYDFLGWNNINPGDFVSSGGKRITPHPLFGSPRVRRALTMAINRQEIVSAYLGTHGQVAFGGVSPLFRWAFNDTLSPLPFDPEKASALLASEGWSARDRDGVLRKDGRRFEFTVTTPTGNQLRMVVAAIIQKELKEIGIQMNIRQVERGTFWQDVTARRYDAFLAGFSVPLQMQLEDLWGSDLNRYPFNLTGFRNARADRILAEARNLRNETDGADLWKEFQVIVQKEQPCTFLFWVNTITGVNTRVGGSDIGVLGTTHHAWKWTTEGSAIATENR
jgi:peptide/nickel transport system substrate-binding protein